MNVKERIGRIRLAPRTVYLIGVGLVAASIGLPLLALWQGPIRYESVGVDETTRELRPELVLLPGGTFTMGSPAGEESRVENEGPQQEVTVSPFLLCRTEITQENWEAVMGNNPSDCDYGCGAKLPVQNISWLDTVAFMNRLTERENTGRAGDKQLSICYGNAGKAVTREIAGQTVTLEKIALQTVSWNRECTGYRLPTEAEWEYAARAGTTTAYSFGDDVSELDAYAWYTRNSGDQVHDVGTKRANPWGLYDMHGNVREWVWDGYTPSYRAQAATDPTGPELRVFPVVRGGSFWGDSGALRSALRVYNFSAALGGVDYGVRCVRAGSRDLIP